MKSQRRLWPLMATTAILATVTAASAQDSLESALTSFGTIGGGNETSAFSIAPEWSEDLGLAARGSVGFMLGKKAALGFNLKSGENAREELLNFGLQVSDSMTLLLSGGQLSENLATGDGNDREWVDQDEFGIGLSADRFELNTYYVDSHTTESFVGAKSYGADLRSHAQLASNANLSYGIGYQRLEWDDESPSDSGLTGSFDLSVATSASSAILASANYNVSEARYGLGAQWTLDNNATVNLNYTKIDGLAGDVQDDQRVSFMLSIPFGPRAAKASPAAEEGAVLSSISSTAASGLLAKVMKRPDYLPARVIVKREDAPSCTLETATWIDPSAETAALYDEFTAYAQNSNIDVAPSDLIGAYDGAYNNYNLLGWTIYPGGRLPTTVPLDATDYYASYVIPSTVFEYSDAPTPRGDLVGYLVSPDCQKMKIFAESNWYDDRG